VGSEEVKGNGCLTELDVMSGKGIQKSNVNSLTVKDRDLNALRAGVEVLLAMPVHPRWKAPP
jgi:hypothetical protein